MKNVIKPPTWFIVVSVIALIWNILGDLAYLGQALITAEALEAMPKEQAELLTNTPAWATAAFAFGVWGGTLGALLLLLRSAFSYYLFWLSFLGIVVQTLYNFILSNAYEVYGPGGLAMPIIVFVIGILLIMLAKRAKREGWVS